jgi:hypothetical protein
MICSSQTQTEYNVSKTKIIKSANRRKYFDSYLSMGVTQDGDGTSHVKCVFYVKKFCKNVLWRLPS